MTARSEAESMAYESFAQVYDEFMEDTPYDQWLEYIKEIFKRHGLINNTNIVAELGCGTGNMLSLIHI